MPRAPEPTPPGFDPSKDTVLDPRTLRGLAHPLRIRLRAELVEHGPATASQLASRIGESSGATSYHLRQLAAYGFVEDEPTLGQGRERYWRAAHRATWLRSADDNPGDAVVKGEYIRAVARLYADRVERFAASIEAMPELLGPEWSDAWDMSDWILDLEPEQAKELNRRFHELCVPYRHNEKSATPAAGSGRMVVQFQFLPLPSDD